MQEERRLEERVQVQQNVQEQGLRQNQVLHAGPQQVANGQQLHQSWLDRLIENMRRQYGREVLIERYNARVKANEEKKNKKRWEAELKTVSDFQKNIKEQDFTGDQILRRVRIFTKAWKMDGDEDENTSRALTKEIDELKKVSAQEPDQEPLNEIRERLEMQKEPDVQAENEFPAERTAMLQAADNWLLRENLKKDPKMKQSIVFSILERPARERMLIYYMIEHKYQEDMRPSFILNSQLTYRPDLKKIMSQKLDYSGLQNIYQKVYAARDTVKVWNEASQKKEASLDLEKGENAADILTKKQRQELGEANSRVLTGMKNLEALTEKYTTSRFISKRSKNKLELEEKMRKQITDLGIHMEQLFALQRERMGNQADAETVRELKETLQKIPEVVKKSKILGVATALLSMCMAFITTSVQLAKGHASMDQLTVAEKALEIANSGLSTGKFVGSSIAERIASSESCTAGVSIAGIAVGAFTQGMGTYNLVHAGIEKRHGKQAGEHLNSLTHKDTREAYDEWKKEKAPVSDDQKAVYRELETRENILKIQQRISNRKQITAGCQIISGMCTTASAACTLTGVGASLGTLLSFSSIAVLGVGAVITGLKKKKQSTEMVDEVLGLEKMVEKKTVFTTSKKEFRERLRQELLEQLGFTSVKGFYSFLMKHYADHIYGKIRSLIETPGKDMENVGDEEKAYMEFVESLGLEIRQKRNVPEGENKQPGLPTSEMIYQKLMG